MKAKEVPQDDADMMRGKFREPVYSVDENGNYTTVKSVGWDPKNTVMQQAWDNINEKVDAVRQKVIDGELSPIAYYMEKQIMDKHLLAQYVGINRWKVKRHMKSKYFNRLNDDIVARYAEVFDLSPAELKDINKIKNEK